MQAPEQRVNVDGGNRARGDLAQLQQLRAVQDGRLLPEAGLAAKSDVQQHLAQPHLHRAILEHQQLARLCRQHHPCLAHMSC